MKAVEACLEAPLDAGMARARNRPRQRSATRGSLRFGRGHGYGSDLPLLRRAKPSSLGPAEILPLLPSAAFQSRDSVLGDRPLSMVAMIAGQASSVDLNRARILLEGISRSEYPIAPSMQISVFSPGFLAKRFGSHGVPGSISGISRSSSVDVFISFALRGAPCGDDPRPRAVRRGYHDDHEALRGVPDGAGAVLRDRMSEIRPLVRPTGLEDFLGFLERYSVLASIHFRLDRIPVQPRHRETIGIDAYQGLIS